MSDKGRRAALLNVRVLDQNVVDDLAGQLHGLIDQAAEAVRQLDERLGTCDQREGEAVDAAGALEQRLHLGLRLLKELDKKAGPELAQQLGAFHGTLSETMDRMDGQRADMDRMMEALEQRSTQFDGQIERQLTEMEAQRHELEAVRVRSDQQVHRLQAELALATSSLDARAGAADEAVGMVEEVLTGLGRQADVAKQDLERKRTEAEETCRGLDAAGAQLREATRDAEQRITLKQQKTVEAVEAIAAELQEHREQLQRGTVEAEHRGHVIAGEIAENTEHWRSEFESAVVFLEQRKQQMQASSQELDDRLSDVNERLSTVEAELRAQSEAVGRAQGRVEVSQRELDERCAAISSEIESRSQSLEDQRARTEDQYDQTRDAIRAALSDVDERIGPMAQRLEQHLGAFDARLDGAVEALAHRAEASGRATLDGVASAVKELSCLRGEATTLLEACRTQRAQVEDRIADATRQLAEVADARRQDIEQAGASARLQTEQLAASIKAQAEQRQSQVADADAQIDERTAAIEAVLEAAVREAQAKHDARMQALGSEAASAFDRLRSVEVETSIRLEAAEAAVRNLARTTSEAIESRGRETDSRMRRLGEQAKCVEASLAAAQARLDEKLRETEAALEAGKAEAQVRMDRLGEEAGSVEASLRSAETRLRPVVDDIDRRVKSFNENLETALMQTRLRIETLAAETDCKIDAALGELLVVESAARDRLSQQESSLRDRLESARAELQVRGDEAQSQVGRVLKEAEGLGATVRALDERLEPQSAQLGERVASFRAEVARALSEVRAAIEEQSVSSGARVETALGELRVLESEAQRRLSAQETSLREGVESARLDLESRRDEAQAQVGRVLEESERLGAKVRGLEERLDPQSAQLDERVASFRAEMDLALSNVKAGHEAQGTTSGEQLQSAQRDLEARRAEAEAESAVGRVLEEAERLGAAVTALDDRLQPQAAALDERVASFRADVEQAMADVRQRIEAQAGSAGAHLKSALEELRAFESDARHRLAVQEQSLRDDIEAASDKLVGQRAEAESDVNLMQQEAQRLGSFVSDLEQRIGPKAEAWAALIELSDASASDLAAARNQFTEEINTAREDLRRHKAEAEIGVVGMQEQVDLVRRSVQELEQRVEPVVSDLDRRVEAFLGSLESSVEGLGSRIDLKDRATNDRIETALAEFHAVRESAQNSAAQLVSQHGNLENQISSIREGLADAKGRADEAIEQLKAWPALIDQRLSDADQSAPVQALRSDVDEVRAALVDSAAQLEERIAPLTAALDEQQRQLDAAQASSREQIVSVFEPVETSVRDIERRIGTASVRVTEEGQGLAELRAEVTAWRHEQQQAYGALDARQAQAVDDLQSRIEDLSGVLAASKLQFESSLEPISSRLDAQQRELEALGAKTQGRIAEAQQRFDASLTTILAAGDESAAVGRTNAQELQEHLSTVADEIRTGLEGRLDEVREQTASTIRSMEAGVASLVEDLKSIRLDHASLADRLATQLDAGHERTATEASTTAEQSDPQSILDVRAELERLAAQVSASTTGLESRLGPLDARLDSQKESLEQISAQVEQQIAEALERVDESLRAHQSDGGEAAAATAAQEDDRKLEERLSDAVDELGMVLDGRIASAREQMSSSMHMMQERLEPLAEELSRTRQDQAALGEDLETQLEQVRRQLASTGSGAGQPADVQSVRELREHVEHLSSEVSSSKVPLDSRLAPISLRLDSQRKDLEELTARTEARIAEAVERVETSARALETGGGERGAAAGADDPSLAERLDCAVDELGSVLESRMQESRQQLGSAVEAMESRIESLLGELTAARQEQAAQAEGVQTQLDQVSRRMVPAGPDDEEQTLDASSVRDLQTQLAQLATQVSSMSSQFESRLEPLSAQFDHHRRDLEDLAELTQRQIAEDIERMDASLGALAQRMDSDGAEGSTVDESVHERLAGVAQELRSGLEGRLDETRAQMASAVDAVQSRMEPLADELGRTRREQTTLAESLEGKLDDVRRQVASLEAADGQGADQALGSVTK